MDNIYETMPKTLAKLQAAHPDKILEITCEGPDGYWIYLKPGWQRNHEEVHCVHEWTVAEAVKAFRTEVCTCGCENCRAAGVRPTAATRAAIHWGVATVIA